MKVGNHLETYVNYTFYGYTENYLKKKYEYEIDLTEDLENYNTKALVKYVYEDILDKEEDYTKKKPIN